MKNSPPRFTGSGDSISVRELNVQKDGWLLACEINQHSARTIDSRRRILNQLLWFFDAHQIQTCGTLELRRFLAYLTSGHKEPGGRWNKPALCKPVRPRTVHTYHGHLRTFFRWLVTEGVLDHSPMERIPVPTSRADQIQPFTPEQVDALLAAAKRSRHPKRDEAILLFLLDTGVRASELCSLRLRDVDMTGRRALVLGKGNKSRSVYFSRPTTKAVWTYLTSEIREPGDPLFQSERGDALTRSGLSQLIERLGDAAGIEAVRCSPHTFRHFAALTFLRAGGNVFSLQQMLGHTSLQMTNRYVALAQADVQNQHRQFSPVEYLKRNKGR